MIDGEYNNEEAVPSHYEISIFSPRGEWCHKGVSAFKLEGTLLQLVEEASTYIYPIDSTVTFVKITPIYEEEKRIVQVP